MLVFSWCAATMIWQVTPRSTLDLHVTSLSNALSAQPFESHQSREEKTMAPKTSAKPGEPFGGVYFGTQEMAGASKKMRLNYGEP